MDAAAEISSLVDQRASTTGETHAQVIALIYKDLRKLAASYIRRERADHTLQATALVHEAYMRIFPDSNFTWEDRAHLFCTMARVMRQVLIDYSRRHTSDKRGGGRKLSLDDINVALETGPEELAALNEAISRLEARDDRQARIAELRYFVGLTVEETAEALGVSEETVKRDWKFAKTWLQKQLRSAYDSPPHALPSE